MSTMHCSLLSLGCVFGFAPANNQGKMTALRALKIAQRRLRPEVRAKLMSVASARTDSSLDQATSGNCRVVTVAAKTSSEHPDTVDSFNSVKTESTPATHAIAQNKWVVDSDKVLAQARGATKLKGIRAAEYHLGQPRSGQEPIWVVYFYAEGEEPAARFQVGAKTGTLKIMGEE